MGSNPYNLPLKNTLSSRGATETRDCFGNIIISDEEFYPVAPDSDYQKLIVRCVNSHDYLVKALEAIYERENERLEHSRKINPNRLVEASIFIIAKEALEKSKGETP